MGVVGSVTTWCTHWLCWCCPLPSHTHRACEARGGGGCVWCGCHHHCAPFPPTTTTVCAAPPCPLCVCWWWDWAQRRTVVARTLVWRCAWRLATTPTSHAVHACRLSSLSCPQTHPPTHTQMALLTPHTHGVLCVPRPIHSLTHWLPHCPHTLHTHWWVCVCSSTCSHAPSHTQRRHRRGACLAALVLWSPPPRPLCHTHTHTGTGGGRHGGGWWWACGHCVAATPRHPLALPATTHATSTTTHTMACCLFGTPCHSHHHHSTPSHTHHNSHCATMVVAIGHHAVHTHPTLATHATHTPRASTGVAVAFGVAPPPRWCWPFAVFSSSLLVHQPLSLSLLHALTHPSHPLINNTTIPSIPCVWCVVLWEWTDGWTTLWLSTPHTALLMGVLIGDTIQPFHPPSPLSLCFCPPPTTTPSLFSVHHTPHTEEKGRVGMDLLVLWVCDGWCGWHVWFVGGVVCWLCFAWLAHPITLSTPNHHHSPLFLSLHHPTLLSLCVWKRGWTTKWMVWNGVWCVACNTSATVLSSSHHQPLCVSRPSPFPSHSQTPSLLPSLFVWFVWTERVKDKCGTHHVKHTVHHIQSTPHSFHPITPPFSMSTWLIGL